MVINPEFFAVCIFEINFNIFSEEILNGCCIGMNYSTGFEMPKDTRFTGRRVAVLALFLTAIGVFVWGTGAHGWYLSELAGLFLALGILSAIIARVSPNEASREFCKGAAEMTTLLYSRFVAR